MYVIKQSTGLTVPFFAHDANGDGVTGLVDGGFTKRISKGSGAFGAMTVTITEMENGWYSFPLSSAHTDTSGLLTISFLHASIKSVNLQWRVEARLLDDLATPTNITAGTITTATNVTTVNGLAANVITATSIAADAITAAKIATGAIDADALAADASAEIADAVWDEDATAHQTQGTFGQAIGDPVADTNTIWGLANTNLDAAVSTRMATYTQPTGFLAATFPSGTIANTTNITAGTITTTTNLTTNNDKTGYRLSATGVDDVWDEPTAGHVTAGTTGVALTDILTDTVEIGAAGAGLTNINLPNQTMDIVGNITGNLSGSVGSVTGAVTVGTMNANVITAASISADAITAAKVAADVSAEIADAVWDEDATAHQTQGTFGQAIGDPVADTNTIFKAVVTDATGATVGVDAAAILADTGTDGVVVAAGSKTGYSLTATTGLGNQTADITGNLSGSVGSVTGAVGSVTGNVGGNVVGSTASVTAGVTIAVGGISSTSFAAGAIDAAAIAADAIGASELATDAVNEIRDAVLPKINTALANIEFLMVDSTDHVTPKTGLTVSGTRSIDGGAFGAVTGTIAEVANGIYQFDASAADMNGTIITFRFTAATADATFLTIKTGG